MTETTVNAELLGQVRQLILDHPERHNQGAWLSNIFDARHYVKWATATMRLFAGQDMPANPADPENPVCGTQGCVAGWLAIFTAPVGSEMDWENLYLPDGTLTPIREFARGRAGLTLSQADYLFHGQRERIEVLAALEYLPAYPDADAEELAEQCGDEAHTHSDYDEGRYYCDECHDYHDE